MEVNNMRKIIDISREVTTGMPVYSGNPTVKIVWKEKLPKASTNLSLIEMGSHTGTHVDAPRHVSNKGRGVDKIPLNQLVGKCRVLDLTKAGREIKKEHLTKYKIKKGEIILCKTKNSNMPFKKFNPDYTYIGVEASEYLRDKKIRTIGVDYLSVQKYHSGNQTVHKNFLTHNITIFEGLNLKNVKAGKYTFIGLPIKIKGCDGAPGRCLLVK